MTTGQNLINHFITGHRKEAAIALEKFEPEELVAYFNDTPVEMLVAVIPGINPQLMLNVFDLMEQEQVVPIMESMNPKQAEILIRMMDDSRAEQILSKLSSDKSLHIRRLLTYMKNWAGSLVEQTSFTLYEEVTIKEALTQVKRHKSSIEPNLFVLSQDQTLRGMVLLSDLIRGNPAKLVTQIMTKEPTFISQETPVQSILDHPAWKEQYLLPVVDNSMVFLGAIRLETIRKIQIKSAKTEQDQNLEAINALGDLYQIGLAGLLKVATQFNPSSE